MIDYRLLSDHAQFSSHPPQTPDQGRRFENLMAVSLVRMAARFTEMGLGVFEVMYIRDKEKREVDFALIKDNKPVRKTIFPALISGSKIYFPTNLSIPTFFQ